MPSSTAAPVSTAGLHARPVGRVLRLLMGLTLTVAGARHLVGGSAGLLVATGGVVAAEIAFYSVAHLAIGRYLPRLNRWLGAALAVTPVAIVFLTGGPAARLGSLLFVGASLLVDAARADAGCEVMSLPGLIFGRRTHLVCLAFSPIDWLEARLASEPTD